MDVHKLRKDIDELIFDVEKTLTNDMDAKSGRAYSLVLTKLQEAKMWSGKILEASGSKLPEEFRDETKRRND